MYSYIGGIRFRLKAVAPEGHDDDDDEATTVLSSITLLLRLLATHPKRGHVTQAIQLGKVQDISASASAVI